MDLIVCGDALWISCGTWVAFWNGAIGALVSAVIGGLVALLVVRLTNAQQRHGVERTVEIAALADCVAAMEGLESALKRVRKPRQQSTDVGIFMAPMRAAVARLQMSTENALPVADILIHWPGQLTQLSMDYEQAIRRRSGSAREVIDVLTNVVTLATVALPWVSSRNKTKRTEALTLLRDADTEMATGLAKFDALWRPQTVGGEAAPDL